MLVPRFAVMRALFRSGSPTRHRRRCRGPRCPQRRDRLAQRRRRRRPSPRVRHDELRALPRHDRAEHLAFVAQSARGGIAELHDHRSQRTPRLVHLVGLERVRRPFDDRRVEVENRTPPPADESPASIARRTRLRAATRSRRATSSRAARRRRGLGLRRSSGSAATGTCVGDVAAGVTTSRGSRRAGSCCRLRGGRTHPVGAV